ncbi:pimeloyl-ACP methyl ester carboxylesterase [Nocardia transvalensis]|uniref:Pimeloyl-ACP methyl ester carboxylesterase n=1 Tax=Nocardia transvalensis TaxID=37333 RepID=A0A7W9PJ09_9NOCA|nr:cutinase family protein [Nocardia transvalensis]MBB5916373.1 pimeloyl-ACP methyl ester carboxylesterase [Nocardia transvalensis]
MLASAAAVSAAVLSGAPAAQAAPGGCPDLYVVAIPGTWETSRDDPREGMLATVTDGLPGDIRTDYVSYTATALPWEGEVYGRSKQEAIDNARGLVAEMGRACGATDIALIGYSQGADAAGDLAAQIGTGLGVVPPDRVAAVGLIADPRRSPTDPMIGPPVPGAGAGGPRVGGFGWVTPRVRSFCAAGDLYCSTPADDFATRFAGFFAQLSSPDPGLISRYQTEAQSIIDDLMAAGGIPLLQSQFSDPANEERRQELEEFYGSGVHQDYPSYVVDGAGTTATTWLRRWLIQAAG